MIRIGVHLTTNGRPSPELAWVDLDHPETANRDIAGVLRRVADHLEEDGKFYEVVLNGLDA